MRQNIPSLEPGCPWTTLSEWAKPNIKWCEENICGWITNPANTWSNLGFVLVALVMAWVARRDAPSRSTRFFAPAAFIVGATSFVYHMSYTFVLQVLDFTGMFVFCYLIILLNVKRMGGIETRDQFKWFWGLVIGSTALVPVLYAMDLAFQGLIVVLILLCIATEAMAYRSARRDPRVQKARYGYWKIAFACLVAAAVFSGLDLSGKLCDPKNHFFQGHAAWHVLNAASLYFLFLFYRQFQKL